MHLANAETAEVPQAKIVDYLLSLTHRDGRGKAIFFHAYGFSLDRWEELAIALRQHAVKNDITKEEVTPFGQRFVVEGKFLAVDGRTPNVRTVWFLDEGETYPRFVTAYPLEAEK
ncbi:DUF6883 domain-containing protein [Armatimonas sp.]|uniref:DUF6883 domain-containing protein n=1 Tax=Armatimonas sp. TaxID=1872638 RepID=UPI0037515A23